MHTVENHFLDTDADSGWAWEGGDHWEWGVGAVEGRSGLGCSFLSSSWEGLRKSPNPGSQHWVGFIGFGEAESETIPRSRKAIP